MIKEQSHLLCAHMFGQFDFRHSARLYNGDTEFDPSSSRLVYKIKRLSFLNFKSFKFLNCSSFFAVMGNPCNFTSGFGSY